MIKLHKKKNDALFIKVIFVNKQDYTIYVNNILFISKYPIINEAH